MINSNLLCADQDPMGAAISDYFKYGKAIVCEYSLRYSTKMKFPSKSSFVRKSKCHCWNAQL